MGSLKNSNGFTMLEILIAGSIMTAIFLVVTTLFVTGKNFSKSIEEKQNKADLLLAMEFIERRATLANAVDIADKNHFKMRWDYGTDITSPRSTPNDFADDYWLKFSLIQGKLYYRAEAAQAGDATDTDPEVMTGLTMKASFIYSGGMISIELTGTGEHDSDVSVYTRVLPRSLATP